MLKIDDVFTSVLAVDWLELDNDAIADYCKDKIYSSSWYKDDKETQSNWLDLSAPELKPLVDAVNDRINELHRRVGLSLHYCQKITEAWTNLDQCKAIREPHLHNDAVFSCVYYVKGDPDTSGVLEFMNPVMAKCLILQPKHIGEYNKFTIDRYGCPPEAGKLIIFPAYLYHYVNPPLPTNTSERISIAFNTQFEFLPDA
jgi:uncharacterized protein (TIGR02466 family)